MSKGSKIRKLAVTFAVTVSVLAPAGAAVATETRAVVVFGVDLDVNEITPKSRRVIELMGGGGGGGGGGEICSDWTNEDGTHGTNCP